MRERNVQRGPRPAHLLGARHDGQGVAGLPAALARLVGGGVTLPTQQFAHGVAAGHVPERPMFEFTGLAHDGAFAVALDALGPHVHGRQQLLRELQAQGRQRVHQRQDVFHVAPGVGVVQHRADGAAAQRLRRHGPAFVKDVFNLGEDAADLDHGGRSRVGARRFAMPVAFTPLPARRRRAGRSASAPGRPGRRHGSGPLAAVDRQLWRRGAGLWPPPLAATRALAR